MTKLADLFPLNLEAELQHFKQDPSYNPQFEYRQPIDPLFLTKWGKPQPKFVELATYILDRYLQTKPDVLPKQVYTETEITAEVDDYFATLNDAPPLPVVFNPHQIARCQVSATHISFRPYLKLSVPDFEGLLRHEIGSHYLRHYNHSLHGLDRFRADDQNRTEEGIAILHTYLFHPQPSLIKSALRYLAADWGQTQSFSEVYARLREKGISHREAWRAVLRTKRGLTDTSQPLVFTKDIMYLEGIIKVLSWLQHPDHEPYLLYQGSLSLEQLATLPEMPQDQVVIPPFMEDLDRYHQHVQTVITYNGLEAQL